MPGMAGTTLCQRLAADPRYQTIPRVLMSATDPTRARVPYITAFLAKPFTIDVLLATVQRYAH
jgi:CheY-like chemotaxis protein